MKIRYWSIIEYVFGILGILLISAMNCQEARAAQDFTPIWEKGQEWTVNVAYPLWSSGDNKGGPSASVSLRFRIEGKQEAKGDVFWVVRVSGQREDRPVNATLYYRIGDFSLASAEVEKTAQGRIIREALTFPPGKPVIFKFSEMPLNQPAFPLISSSRQAYELEREIGDGLKIREKVFQVVKNVRGKTPGTTFEVTLENGEGQMIFQQRWEKGKPWAVKGTSENMRYELVNP